jgi:hypothetical protein
MVKKYSLILLALVLFLVIFSLVLKFLPKKEEKATTALFQNPDLIMGNQNTFISFIPLEKNVDGWIGEGYYIYGPIDGDYGVIAFPPFSKKSERVIGTFLPLKEDKNYTLIVKMGNIAGKVEIAKPITGCDDSVIVIQLLDFSSGDEYIIDKVIVNANDRWIERSYDLTPFKGKIYYLRIAGVAGGPCGNWAGEWSAISYLNVV